MEKLGVAITLLAITATGLLIVIGAVVPSARRLAGKVFVGYVLIPALATAVLTYLIACASKALAGMSAPSWLLLVPVLLLAPIVALVLGLKLLTGIVHIIFGERAAGHVGGVLALRLIDRLFGRHRGRPIPAAEDAAEDQPHAS